MTRDRRRDGDRTDDRPDRGQVILIGAIALAFIVLGLVVVFNGVLYTETLSSGETGQSASDIDRTELEIKKGIGCLIAEYEGNQTDNDDLTGLDGSVDDSLVSDDLKDDIEQYSAMYRNATAHSRPTAVQIETESNIIAQVDDGVVDIEPVRVTISSDSHEHSYSRTVDIDAGECPS